MEDSLGPMTTHGGAGRAGARRRSSFWWLGSGAGAGQGSSGLELGNSSSLDQMFEGDLVHDPQALGLGEGAIQSAGVAPPHIPPPLNTNLSSSSLGGGAPWNLEPSLSGISGMTTRRRSTHFSSVYPFPPLSSSQSFGWDKDATVGGGGGRKSSIASIFGISEALGTNDARMGWRETGDDTTAQDTMPPKPQGSSTKKKFASVSKTKNISPKNIDGGSPKNKSPKASSPRKRRDKPAIQTKVISNITSSRAKQADVIYCTEIPEKSLRIKGTVYNINGERKKWDGRQWRRICVVVDCYSAARGAIDFCIIHGRGELEESIVAGEVVKVIKDGPNSPKSGQGSPKSGKQTDKSSKARSKRAETPITMRSLSYSNSMPILGKRKSQADLVAAGKMKKITKHMGQSSIGQASYTTHSATCACGAQVSSSEPGFPSCASCWPYRRPTQIG